MQELGKKTNHINVLGVAIVGLIAAESLIE